MECDQARARLTADVNDSLASEHLQGCTACFEALEAADPVARLLIAAQPIPSPAPAALARAILDHWRPAHAPARRMLWVALAAAALGLAVLAEALVGVDPARLTSSGLELAAFADAWLEGALMAMDSARSILVDSPLLLFGLTAATLAACGLWLKMVVTPPVWRLFQ